MELILSSAQGDVIEETTDCVFEYRVNRELEYRAKVYTHELAHLSKGGNGLYKLSQIRDIEVKPVICPHQKDTFTTFLIKKYGEEFSTIIPMIVDDVKNHIKNQLK